MLHDRRGRILGLTTALLLTAGALTACSDPEDEIDPTQDAAQVDAIEVPELGACRLLTPEDVLEASNSTRTVPCSEEHTAQTFAVGDLPAKFDDVAHDEEKLGAWAYRTCSKAFEKFLGADESLVMRTLVSWAWFRPSEAAWEQGARWYRCDIVGGSEESETFVPLPVNAQGLLQGPPPDEWMVCVDGPTVVGAARVPCSEPHTWRAVTTIKLGEPKDDYPGDRVVEVTTRDFCSDSVGAWLGYPVDYDFGYTWFHEAEWDAGNRRSICWAKTAQ